MKWSVFLLCVSVCILAFLLPVTSAACIPYVPPVPTETYSPPGPYGTIYVESSPAGAYIYINHELRGRAPLTITGIWPGSYEIAAEMDGFETYTTTTTISGPTRSAVYCPLTPEVQGNGLVIISSPDSATVFFDGVEKGVTPLSLGDLAAGSHTVQLRLSGYDDWKSTIDIDEGRSKTISKTLTRKTMITDQGVSLKSNPSGASVTLDGLVKGFTPITLNNLAAGIHIIQIDYPGYSTWKSTVDVPENGIKDLFVTMDPKPAGLPGWIIVSSSPGNASVTLDGTYVGRTFTNSSTNLNPVTAGEHTIVMELSGYQTYSTKVSVSPSLGSSVKAVLVPVSGSPVQGALSVSSDPAGAHVMVDNKSIGISPITANEIPAGDHLITIEMDGYQNYSASIVVNTGTTSTVSATLLPVTSPLYSPVSPVIALGALGIIGFLVLRKCH